MKLRERTHTFTFPVYCGYAVHVVVTNDIVSSRARRDATLGGPYDGGPVHALHSIPADGHAASWLFFDENDVGAGELAHECWHCVYAMMNWIGAEIENEVVGYHLGFLVSNIEFMLLEKKGKVKTYERV